MNEEEEEETKVLIKDVTDDDKDSSTTSTTDHYGYDDYDDDLNIKTMFIVFLFNVCTTPILMWIALAVVVGSAVVYFCLAPLGFGLPFLWMYTSIASIVLTLVVSVVVVVAGGTFAVRKDLFAAVVQKISEFVSHVQFVLGIHDSTVATLLTQPFEEVGVLWKLYDSLFKFLVKQEILPELTTTVSVPLAVLNNAMLGVCQKSYLDRTGSHRSDGRLLGKDSEEQEVIKSTIHQRFPMEDIRHYMRYAEAGYGENAVKAARYRKTGKSDLRIGFGLSTTRISEYLGIPKDDLVVMNVSYKSDVKQLRYFIALDRSRRAIVLAVSGTYSCREMLLDANGYAKRFLDGGAHAAIAFSSQRLWDGVKPKIMELMDEHKDYELVVTGHSLGGGASCLLNLILHNDEDMKDRNFRVFAFASPPVVTWDLLEASKGRRETCINIIDQYDVVPFMSGDSVRHHIAAIAEIQRAKLGLIKCIKLFWGWEKPDPDLVQRVHDILNEPLPKVREGLPPMFVAATANLWFFKNEDSIDENNNKSDHYLYKSVVGDPAKMGKAGIFVRPGHQEFFDHIPSRYLHVLENADG